MIKVKKLLSLLIVIFLILSNIAFAQYSDPSNYEGRPIDESKEGKEYYREGQVIVYPAKISSEEERMMERFARGDISEEEMRRIAKSKFGKDFDEMEFKKGMMEFKERMMRKEAFSYEHEGYEQRYYVSPSYEGYSKEHMVFGMIFQHIGDDIDPREIKQYCNEPEKIADNVISKLKYKVGDLQRLCSQAEEQEAKCQEFAKKGCAQLGTPYVREDATELEKLQSIAYSCPVNKDAIIKACVLRSKANIEQNIRHATESCEKMFEHEGERLLRECERFKENQICERDKYIERCMGGIKKEDFERKGSLKCGEYRRNDVVKKVCATCGNKICESYETCTSSSCTESYCTQDCGSLYCKEDCIETKPEAKSEVCPVDAQRCPDGTYVKRVSPSCDFEPCPTTTKCPSIPPAGCPIYECVEGAISVQDPVTCCYKCQSQGYVPPHCKETDGGYDIYNKGLTYPDGVEPGKSDVCLDDKTLAEYGCNSDGSYGGDRQYTCEFGCKDGACLRTAQTTACPTVQKPICAADETLQTYYDNAGCITSYQCIKLQTTVTCPSAPEKPTCGESQSLTTKHDEKGCVIGYECVTVTTNASSTAITGQAVLNTYEDFLRQCENSWREQERACASMLESCDKDALIERCKQQSRKNYEDHLSKIEQNCHIYSGTEIRAAEDRCSRIDEERKRCFEESNKRCEHMKGIAQQCKEFLTEDSIRKFILEEVKKRCKFTGIIHDEDDVRKADNVEIVLAILNTATKADIEKLELFVDDLEEDLKLQNTIVYKGMINPNNFGDIKLLPFVVNAKISAVPSAERAKEVKAKIVARQKVEEAASKLVSLRDSDVPSEYLYIIEDKASEVLDVSDELEDIEKKEEQKGLGYKIRLFLGLAKKAEEVEIKQLGESKEKLKNSIETLTKLVDEVPSDIAKAILKEQVENLKEQQQEIEVLIETKEKKAKGLFGIFG